MSTWLSRVPTRSALLITPPKPALEKVEVAYAAYIAERDKPVGRDDAKLKQLEQAWKDAIAAADKYVVPNAFGKIVEQNGGEDMNAFTTYDETAYHYSFPENRLELWAYLESERFLHPVLREFYKERNVVIEERRMRVDSSPFGRLLEQFTEEAFAAHPYHRPTIGWISDLNHFSATDAAKFFDKYYVPADMVVAVAGDIKAEQAMPILEKYFGRLPTRPKPDESTTMNRRRTPSAELCWRNRRSRFISRATIVPITAAKTMRCSMRLLI